MTKFCETVVPFCWSHFRRLCSLSITPLQSMLLSSCWSLNCTDLHAHLSRKCCLLMYGLYILIYRGMVMSGISLTMPMCTSLICITVESIHEIDAPKLQSGVVSNSHTSLKTMNTSIRWKSEYSLTWFTKLIEYKSIRYSQNVVVVQTLWCETYQILCGVLYTI